MCTSFKIFFRYCYLLHWPGTKGQWFSRWMQNGCWALRCFSIKPNVSMLTNKCQDHVIKWKHFPCYLSSVRGIHHPPVNSPHKGLWGELIMRSLWRHCKVQNLYQYSKKKKKRKRFSGVEPNKTFNFPKPVCIILLARQNYSFNPIADDIQGIYNRSIILYVAGLLELLKCYQPSVFYWILNRKKCKR